MQNGNGGARQWATAGKCSGRVLAVLIALAGVLFAAFFAVGFDLPSPDNPAFNAPLLTDALLYFTYALCAIAAVAATVSAAHAIRVRSAAGIAPNGVHSRRIAVAVVGVTVASLALTFAFASTDPLEINGETFGDPVWLRLTDMFVNTSLILAAVAAVAVGFGVAGVQRRRRKGRKEAHK